MSFERRPDRRGRPGGRVGGGRTGAPRDRGDRPQREFGERPQREFGERPQREFGDRPQREFGDRQQRGSFNRVPRSGARADDGGMSIRLDPRRLAALKLLAAEAGVRPGELVTSWVEKRLDEARGGQAPIPQAAAQAAPQAQHAMLEALTRRLDALERRLDAQSTTPVSQAPAATAATGDASAATAEAAPRKRGRPRKAASGEASGRARRANPAVPLHEEIAEVIRERGAMSAADLATAIVERGRYAPPRSSKPLDAATVNSRVSNPAYRDRFVRSDGRIDLAPSS